MNRLPPLNSLKCFESAARHGSFNKAARELNVTPSAISHQIKGLEEFLDLELFRRTKRKVVLTEAGEKYLGPIKQMFQLLEQATADLHTAQHAGSLHLAVAPSFLTRWLMPRMERFQQRYPDIELEISSSMGLIDFSIGKVDMAVYFGAGDWDDVEMYYLRPIRLAPVCSPKMIKPSNPINEPEDMRFYPLLHVSKRSDEWTDWLVQNGLDPKVFRRGLMFSSGSLTAGAASQGLGIALSDVSLIGPELESGQLKVLFDKQLDTNRSFYLVYEKDRAITPAMTAFKEWIIEEMNDG
ncbi:transcriptional regulator [Marinomonas piezotolerans]|uniref:Transcriptional regulator n=1 Tax=Marinomonas piezotolerans TaxID=2213058 RepID=A0A370U643_9GAMM|nr:transcriptional regulator GcvA [Marinomonas piezotolerans]RDL43213.1 transcriptional regulator [Marinomonas piezotolerans]